MKRLKFITLLSIMMASIMLFAYILLPNKVKAIAYTWGSRGIPVQQIQMKLKSWGYYDNKIDGIYGQGTWEAVKNFQGKNGLYTDGIAGDKTLAKMGIFPDAISASTGNQIYTWGARGETVKEIQRKLKSWGYYTGSIDGVYGYNTWLAIRKFQSKNGLKIDGVAGGNTLKKIGIYPSSSTSSGQSTNRETYLLAAAINGEARGEPYLGMVAVGAVIMNRTRNSKFPNTVAGVIYQPGAFDAVADGQINLTPSEESIKAAKDSLNGWDPTGGCIYYWNPVTATSKWIWSRTVVTKIGKHNFGK